MLKVKLFILALAFSIKGLSQINIWEGTACHADVILTPYLSFYREAVIFGMPM